MSVAVRSGGFLLSVLPGSVSVLEWCLIVSGCGSWCPSLSTEKSHNITILSFYCTILIMPYFALFCRFLRLYARNDISIIFGGNRAIWCYSALNLAICAFIAVAVLRSGAVPGA